MQHRKSKHEWTAKVDMYLGVFNDQGVFTLPASANMLYAGQGDPSNLFSRMALQILGEMYVRRMPISNRFKEMLGPAYASESESEKSESEESESEESQGRESEEDAESSAH